MAPGLRRQRGGWLERPGEVEPPDERSKVRAAARRELARPSLRITTAHHFPTLQPAAPRAQQRPDLHASLGVIVFHGPQGAGFFKGGHNATTANTLVCLESGQRAVLILASDVRAEAAFADRVQFILGDTGVPYEWEYGNRAGKS